jgi:hypothetical protein
VVCCLASSTSVHRGSMEVPTEWRHCLASIPNYYRWFEIRRSIGAIFDYRARAFWDRSLPSAGFEVFVYTVIILECSLQRMQARWRLDSAFEVRLYLSHVCSSPVFILSGVNLRETPCLLISERVFLVISKTQRSFEAFSSERQNI